MTSEGKGSKARRPASEARQRRAHLGPSGSRGTTRRDFVAMLLGAPLALACNRTQRHLPPGTLVDTGMARAHAAIRDGTPPNVNAWRRHRVVVVGGGVAGLGAAWELRRRGISDVVVLELDDTI